MNRAEVDALVERLRSPLETDVDRLRTDAAAALEALAARPAAPLAAEHHRVIEDHVHALRVAIDQGRLSAPLHGPVVEALLAALASPAPVGEAERLREAFKAGFMAVWHRDDSWTFNGPSAADKEPAAWAAWEAQNRPEARVDVDVAALAPRAQELCKSGHNYRRNAPPQAGDVCTVCRVAVWQPGLPAHHGVTPSPETQPATNGADGADVLGPHPGGRDLRVEFHQDGSYTVHDTRPGPRKFVRLVTDAEWPPPAPGAGVALSAEQSGYVRQLERLVARVRAGEVRFLRYAATNGTREVDNGDIRLIEPTGEVELTLWYQQRVAPDDRALDTASRTENRRHP